MKTYGIIKGVDGINYILNYKEITSILKDNLKKGDYVEFTPEAYNTVETNLFIARNIQKISKENNFNEEQKTKGIK